MINKHLPHLLVLPEDDEDRELANGFALHTAVDPRKIQVLPTAGGWLKALAEDCRTRANRLWSHPELSGNATTLKRLRTAVEPWLFR